jgi:hypothetical protein
VKRIAASLMVLVLGGGDLAHAAPRDSTYEVRRLMRDYARCVAPKYHREAVLLVTSTMDSSAFGKKFPSLAIKDVDAAVRFCQPPLIIPRTMRVSFLGDPLRFALAEALIERDWKSVTLADFTAVPALPAYAVRPRAELDADLARFSNRARQEQLRTDYNRTVAIAWLMQFGECVARREPQNTKVLALSDWDTPVERDALQKLGPAFGDCLAEGEQLQFNKSLLRGALAVSYVRLAEAHRSVQAKVTQ